MTQFQNDVFPGPDCHNFSSGVATDKGAAVTRNGKASSRLRDMSTVTQNAWQSS